MNKVYLKTFLDYVGNFFNDAVVWEFPAVIGWPNRHDDDPSLNFFKHGRSYLLTMIGPYNQNAYTGFKEWLIAIKGNAANIWTAHEQAELITDKLTPTGANFVRKMLNKYRKAIYEKFDQHTFTIRNDDLSGWGQRLEGYIMNPNNGHGFSADKGQEIVDKLQHYADALIRIIGTNFFRTFQNPQQLSGSENFFSLMEKNVCECHPIDVVHAALGLSDLIDVSGIQGPQTTLNKQRFFSIQTHVGAFSLKQFVKAMSFHYNSGSSYRGRARLRIQKAIMQAAMLIIMEYPRIKKGTDIFSTKKNALTVKILKPIPRDTQGGDKRENFTLEKVTIASIFFHKCLYQAQTGGKEGLLNIFERTKSPDQALKELITILEELFSNTDKVDARGLSSSESSDQPHQVPLPGLENVADPGRARPQIDYTTGNLTPVYGGGARSPSQESDFAPSDTESDEEEDLSNLVRVDPNLSHKPPKSDDDLGEVSDASDASDDEPLDPNTPLRRPAPWEMVHPRLPTGQEEEEIESKQEEPPPTTPHSESDSPEARHSDSPEAEEDSEDANILPEPAQEIHHHHYPPPVYQPSTHVTYIAPPEEEEEKGDGSMGAIMAVVGLLFLASLFRGGGGGNY